MFSNTKSRTAIFRNIHSARWGEGRVTHVDAPDSFSDPAAGIFQDAARAPDNIAGQTHDGARSWSEASNRTTPTAPGRENDRVHSNGSVRNDCCYSAATPVPPPKKSRVPRRLGCGRRQESPLAATPAQSG